MLLQNECLDQGFPNSFFKDSLENLKRQKSPKTFFFCFFLHLQLVRISKISFKITDKNA